MQSVGLCPDEADRPDPDWNRVKVKVLACLCHQEVAARRSGALTTASSANAIAAGKAQRAVPLFFCSSQIGGVGMVGEDRSHSDRRIVRAVAYSTERVLLFPLYSIDGEATDDPQRDGASAQAVAAAARSVIRGQGRAR